MKTEKSGDEPEAGWDDCQDKYVLTREDRLQVGKLMRALEPLIAAYERNQVDLFALDGVIEASLIIDPRVYILD